MSQLPLGEKTTYKDKYDSTLLYPINRQPLRTLIGIFENLPFYGYDVWNCYEFSWLTLSGKPQVRILELIIPASSENIIESKSLKLYLNSFHNTKFSNEDEVRELIIKDISSAVGLPIEIKLKKLQIFKNNLLTSFEGKNIDENNITIDKFEYDKNLLQLEQEQKEVTETLYSDLLKANCLVTGQPDWGSIMINYKGPQIAHKSLLKYIISFRNQNEFAEPCAERIFIDIMNYCKPKELTIYIRFTRRGGIDINPIRSTENFNSDNINNSRQIRQ